MMTKKRRRKPIQSINQYLIASSSTTLESPSHHSKQNKDLYFAFSTVGLNNLTPKLSLIAIPKLG
jgi:hypothetical protein